MREIRQIADWESINHLTSIDSETIRIGRISEANKEVSDDTLYTISTEVLYQPENPFSDLRSEIQARMEIYPEVNWVMIEAGSNQIIQDIISELNSGFKRDIRILPNIGLSRNQVRGLVSLADQTIELSTQGKGTEDESDAVKHASLYFSNEGFGAEVIYDDGHIWVRTDSERAYNHVLSSLLEVV